MPQLQLPIFPDGVTYITNQLAFKNEDGQVTYFNGIMPVFSHAESDIATFRMITSQFCVTGHVKQSDIIRAFGVTSISVKRSVKIYREKGPKGFYAPRVTRGPAVLVEDVVSEIEGRLAGGATPAEVAKTLGMKLNTIQKAMREGRIRAAVKKIPWRCRSNRERCKRECHRGFFRFGGGDELNKCAAFAERRAIVGTQHQERAGRSRLCRADGTRRDRNDGAAGGEPWTTAGGRSALCLRSRHCERRRPAGCAGALGQRAVAAFCQVLSPAGWLLRSHKHLFASGLHDAGPAQVDRGTALLRAGRMGQIAGPRPRSRSAHLAHQAQAFG